MSKSFLTNAGAYDKLEKTYSGSQPAYFITKTQAVVAGADSSKLTSYSNEDFVVDDDLAKPLAAEKVTVLDVGTSNFPTEAVSGIIFDVLSEDTLTGIEGTPLNNMTPVDLDVQNDHMVIIRLRGIYYGILSGIIDIQFKENVEKVRPGSGGVTNVYGSGRSIAIAVELDINTDATVNVFFINGAQITVYITYLGWG